MICLFISGDNCVGNSWVSQRSTAGYELLRLIGCTPAPLIFRLKNRFRPYGESLLANAPKGTKRSVPLHPGHAALDSPHSIIAPRARREGPSLAHRGFHRSTLYTTIAFGLLKGRLAYV